MQGYVNAILDRMFIDSSGIGGTLDTVADATPIASQLGFKARFLDPNGNIVTLVYAKLADKTVSYAAGGAVYWEDAAHTTVSDDPTKALGYVASSDSAVQAAAGVVMNASLANGQAGWFQCGGKATLPVGTVTKGDLLVLSNVATTAPTADVWTRIAVGTAAGTAEAISTLYGFCTVAGTTTVTAMLMGNAAGLAP